MITGTVGLNTTVTLLSAPTARLETIGPPVATVQSEQAGVRGPFTAAFP